MLNFYKWPVFKGLLVFIGFMIFAKVCNALAAWGGVRLDGDPFHVASAAMILWVYAQVVQHKHDDDNDGEST